jgi:hypothetical protein
MRDLKTVYMLSIALFFTLATYGLAMASNTCHATLSNGSGANFYRFCVSNHGNLLTFEFPQGRDHIAAEGYALCNFSGGNEIVQGYDTGGSESPACGSPTISQPNGANTLPLTITRTCNCLRLKQDFARDNPEKDVTITMTLTNVCSPTLGDVRVSRYFDGDIHADTGFDIYDVSLASVWARDFEALSLTALTFGTAHEALVEEFSDWNPASPLHTATGCSAFGEGAPTQLDGTTNFVGRVTYFLGALSANQSKTVKVVYRRL